MEKNNIYLVQDSDRPLWVIAPNWTAALEKWKKQIAVENDQKPEEVDEPQGISLVCEADDLIC